MSPMTSNLTITKEPIKTKSAIQSKLKKMHCKNQLIALTGIATIVSAVALGIILGLTIAPELALIFFCSSVLIIPTYFYLQSDDSKLKKVSLNHEKIELISSIQEKYRSMVKEEISFEVMFDFAKELCRYSFLGGYLFYRGSYIDNSTQYKAEDLFRGIILNVTRATQNAIDHDRITEDFVKDLKEFEIDKQSQSLQKKCSQSLEKIITQLSGLVHDINEENEHLLNAPTSSRIHLLFNDRKNSHQLPLFTLSDFKKFWLGN